MSVKTTCKRCDMPRSVTDGGSLCRNCKWLWPHDPPACAACKTRYDTKPDDPKSRAFLCHACLGELPDEMRRALLQIEDADSLHIKNTVLSFLGIDPRDVKIRLPRRTLPKEPECHCEKPRPIEQAVLGGGVTVQCRRCGNTIQKRAS